MTKTYNIEDNSTAVARKLAADYHPLPQDDIALFASIMQRHTAAKGEQLISDGEICDSYLYIHAGLARQYYYKNGHDITEHFTAEGDLLYCIESLYAHTPTQLLAEALEPLIYYTIPYLKLKELTMKSTEIAQWYIRQLEMDAIISQHKADTQRFETARERFDRFQQEYPEAARRASNIHIASYLLMTPESLSRIRAGKL